MVKQIISQHWAASVLQHRESAFTTAAPLALLDAPSLSECVSDLVNSGMQTQTVIIIMYFSAAAGETAQVSLDQIVCELNVVVFFLWDKHVHT